MSCQGFILKVCLLNSKLTGFFALEVLLFMVAQLVDLPIIVRFQLIYAVGISLSWNLACSDMR
jgi:hypothetical protein